MCEIYFKQIKNTACLKQTQNKSFTYKLILILHIIAVQKIKLCR